MSDPRLLWIDKTGQPVITTTANGERNARRWGWTPARALPAPAPDPSCARCHLTKREHQVGYSASRCTYIPASAPAPAPSVVPEAAVTLRAVIDEALADALGDTFSPSVMDDLARRVHARVSAALPILTAAPSATREVTEDEVTEVVTEALTDAYRAERGMSRHRGLSFEAESAIRERVARVVDLVTARFTITPEGGLMSRPHIARWWPGAWVVEHNYLQYRFPTWPAALDHANRLAEEEA